MSDIALPAPLTPPDCDLRGIDPPWELFRQMAIGMGAKPEQADVAIADAKAFHAQWLAGAGSDV